MEYDLVLPPKGPAWPMMREEGQAGEVANIGADRTVHVTWWRAGFWRRGLRHATSEDDGPVFADLASSAVGAIEGEKWHQMLCTRSPCWCHRFQKGQAGWRSPKNGPASPPRSIGDRMGQTPSNIGCILSSTNEAVEEFGAFALRYTTFPCWPAFAGRRYMEMRRFC